jgi:hypothetical protein
MSSVRSKSAGVAGDTVTNGRAGADNESGDRGAGPGGRGTGSIVRAGLAVFAFYSFAVAVLMVFAPHTFFVDVGPFGVQNDHYLRDTATFEVALGVGLTVAIWRERWRTPVLCVVALQFALHTLNHLADIGEAHPYWLGPADFISLALATLALAWLACESMRPLEVQR